MEKKAIKAKKAEIPETKKASVKKVQKKEKSEKSAIKKKNALLKKIQKKIRKKLRKPVFRGRFGRRFIHRIHKAKWNRWRKPRGIDIKRKQEDGRMPRAGYGTPRKIRAIHPSGYREAKVFKLNDLGKINTDKFAARISSTIGKKKRIEIIKRAKELGVHVFNR